MSPPTNAERRPDRDGVQNGQAGGRDQYDHNAQVGTNVTGRRVAQLWKAAVATARAECGQRRGRVLQHADLALRLTAPPLSYPRPELWSGFVPPRTVPGHRLDVLNTSPCRQALVEIATEALARERQST